MRAELAALALTAALLPAAAQVPQVLAEGVWLLPGRFERGRQPDANSLLLQGPDGLLVLDSGRHIEHAQAIETWVRGRGAPLRAVLNTHWHLDHVGGNAVLRQGRPELRTLGSRALGVAVERTMAASEIELKALRARSDTDAGTRRMVDVDLGLYAVRASFTPDEVIEGALQERTLAGRRVRIGIDRGPTQGDLWLLDPASGTLAVGDFITLPVPFLDTACAPQWQQALGRLEALPFERVVPGHGPVLDRDGFRRWRQAFDRLLACAGSGRAASACADDWATDLGPLLAAEDRPRVAPMLAYYIGEHLRATPAQRDRFCSGPG